MYVMGLDSAYLTLLINQPYVRNDDEQDHVKKTEPEEISPNGSNEFG